MLEKVWCGLVVARGNAPEILEPAVAALDEWGLVGHRGGRASCDLPTGIKGVMPSCRSELEWMAAMSAAAKLLIVIRLPNVAAASRSIHCNETLDLRPLLII
jgi:hypothetical protein